MLFTYIGSIHNFLIFTIRERRVKWHFEVSRDTGAILHLKNATVWASSITSSYSGSLWLNNFVGVFSDFVVAVLLWWSLFSLWSDVLQSVYPQTELCMRLLSGSSTWFISLLSQKTWGFFIGVRLLTLTSPLCPPDGLKVINRTWKQHLAATTTTTRPKPKNLWGQDCRAIPS